VHIGSRGCTSICRAANLGGGHMNTCKGELVRVLTCRPQSQPRQHPGGAARSATPPRWEPAAQTPRPPASGRSTCSRTSWCQCLQWWSRKVMCVMVRAESHGLRHAEVTALNGPVAHPTSSSAPPPSAGSTSRWWLCRSRSFVELRVPGRM
jgi:hypothetical protein